MNKNLILRLLLKIVVFFSVLLMVLYGLVFFTASRNLGEGNLPQIFGVNYLPISDDSMSPLLEEGEAVFIGKNDFSFTDSPIAVVKLLNTDPAKSNTVEDFQIVRVSAIEEDNITVSTFASSETFVLSSEQIVGKVTTSVPFLGSFILSCLQVSGIIIFLFIPLVILILSLVLNQKLKISDSYDRHKRIGEKKRKHAEDQSKKQDQSSEETVIDIKEGGVPIATSEQNNTSTPKGNQGTPTDDAKVEEDPLKNHPMFRFSETDEIKRNIQNKIEESIKQKTLTDPPKEEKKGEDYKIISSQEPKPYKVISSEEVSSAPRVEEPHKVTSSYNPVQSHSEKQAITPINIENKIIEQDNDTKGIPQTVELNETLKKISNIHIDDLDTIQLSKVLNDIFVENPDDFSLDFSGMQSNIKSIVDERKDELIEKEKELSLAESMTMELNFIKDELQGTKEYVIKKNDK